VYFEDSKVLARGGSDGRLSIKRIVGEKEKRGGEGWDIENIDITEIDGGEPESRLPGYTLKKKGKKYVGRSHAW